MSDPSLVTATQKTQVEPTPEREFVRRKIKNRLGAGNILIIKKGEDLRSNLKDRLQAMKDDFADMKFHAEKLLTDMTYNETKEYPGFAQREITWQLTEGVANFIEYKSKMKRLKLLIDHFQPGKDYELTVDEAVEILS